MSLLITNVTLFSNDDENRLLSGHAVATQGARICAVGPEPELRDRFVDRDEIDGGGRLLMPGLTNVHMHLYGTFARGLPLTRQSKNFVEILENLWWRLDRSLDLEAVYLSALTAAISAVRTGCTSMIDHHASPRAVEGSLDRIEEALALVGLRGLLCYEVSDRDGYEVRSQGLDENARYIRQCRDRSAIDPDHTFNGMVGLHAPFTLNDESLTLAGDLSASLGSGCHIHLLEDRADQRICRQKFGAGAAERLAQFGVLGKRSLIAHGIHLDPSGMDIIADTDTLVAHQAQSNMNNAVGRADVFEMLRRGITVGIGTDGMTTDVRAEARTGFLLHRHHLGDCNAGWVEYEKMTLKNNPDIYRKLTGQKVGRIEQGYFADMILLDYDPPTPMTAGNFWGHFLYGIADCNVNTSIVNGRVVMHNKEILHVDEARIAASARLCAENVWQRFTEIGAEH